MIKLLINKPGPEAESETSFGGHPVKGVNVNFEWPICNYCKGPMQFLGKLVTDKGIEQIFMCQNDPGLCEEWDSSRGGNKVIVTTAGELEFVQPPEGDDTTRETSYGSDIVECESNDYDEARKTWAENNEVSPRQVLGQIYGNPLWIQGDETPTCDTCQKPMRFVAQLEEGPDWETEMNFGGGGCAYLFDCSCDFSAKFLWQC